MTDAKEILKLIESVDPSDAAAMDELDAKVWCWMDRSVFIKMHEPYPLPHLPEFIKERGKNHYNEALYEDMKYSRFKKSLEYIVPLGWGGMTFGDSRGFYSHLFTCGEGDRISFESPKLPSSCLLSKLYVVIQAIQYEREKS